MDTWATKMESMWLRLKYAMANLDMRIAELHVAQANLDTRMAELADARARTDQRFNALVEVVTAERKAKGST